MTEQKLFELQELKNKIEYLFFNIRAAEATKETLLSGKFMTTSIVALNEYAPKDFMDVYISNLEAAAEKLKKEFESI